MGGHERLAKELMMSGADVEALNSSDGNTALHVAGWKGLDKIVSILLIRGTDKDEVNIDGDSALMWASGAYEFSEARLAVVETLLAAGADFNIRRSDNGYSALDWASCSGHVPTIQALVRHGVDVNSRYDTDGRSALHIAAIADQANSVDALVEAGADMEMKSSIGRTPLSVAALDEKPASLLALLQKGAAVSVQDNEEETPLHLACYFKCKGIGAVVNMLLRWGADETALDNDGDSPEDLLDRVHEDRMCSEADIERVRLLLARAPVDRAWRRRGWLAMLRSRASRADAIAGGEGAEESNDAGDGVGGSRKVAGIEDVAGAGGGEGEQASGGGSGGGALEIVGGFENGVFSDAVVRLVGLKPEGVFRTVLEFL